MKTFEETLNLALEAFWDKVQELHPERERANLPGPEQYDLENFARNAVDAWLVLNKPTFYVQRTVTQVLRVTGADTPEEAEVNAADIDHPVWFSESLGTEIEYIVLGPNGEVLT